MMSVKENKLPEKTVDTLPCNRWFLHEMKSENKCRISILMSYHYPDLGVLLIGWKSASSNQKHYRDLGCDTSLTVYTKQQMLICLLSLTQQFAAVFFSLLEFYREFSYTFSMKISVSGESFFHFKNSYSYLPRGQAGWCSYFCRELTVCIPVSVQFLSLYLYKI